MWLYDEFVVVVVVFVVVLDFVVVVVVVVVVDLVVVGCDDTGRIYYYRAVPKRPFETSSQPIARMG